MLLLFKLSMPNVGSWNGEWSGQEHYYAKVINIGRSKANELNAEIILDKEYFHYDFGDGWAAGVSVLQVNSSEAAAIRRKSDGFSGYDWMIDSIIECGEIKV